MMVVTLRRLNDVIEIRWLSGIENDAFSLKTEQKCTTTKT